MDNNFSLSIINIHPFFFRLVIYSIVINYPYCQGQSSKKIPGQFDTVSYPGYNGGN